MTTLLQAHQRFSEKLDELRRRYVATYEVWLKSLPGDSLDALQRAGRDRLAIERKKFADEFVDQPAADLVHALNPSAERDIMRTLRTFEARSEPLRPTMPAGERRWMPSLWRTVL